MKGTLRILLLTILILAIAATLVYWWGLPQLTSMQPPDGAVDVKAGSEIRLAFSRRMQPESVIDRIKIEPPVQGRFTWQGQTLVFQPDQPWKAGSAVTVQLDPGARTAGSLSFHMRQGGSWSFRTRQPALAYLYPSGAPANIYTLNPLSGESTPLTDQAGGVIDFSINSAGSAIYYSAQLAGGGSAIYRLDLDFDQSAPEVREPPGIPASLLVWDCPDALCRMPVASPQGDILAFERTAHPVSGAPELPQVWLLPLSPVGAPAPESAPVPRLAGDPAHQTLQPSWSRDGLLAFYDSQLSAFVFLNPANAQAIFFPNQTGQPGAWHPGGHFFVAPEINFLDTNISENVQGLQALANSHLILFDYLEKTTQDLSIELEAEDTSPSFSPDGATLAFSRKYLDTRRWTPGRQIWMLNLSLIPRASVIGQARPLYIASDYNHYDLAWNPNGEQIATVRFNQTIPIEPPEIWLVDPFTGRAVKLITGGYAPAWIP